MNEFIYLQDKSKAYENKTAGAIYETGLDITSEVRTWLFSIIIIVYDYKRYFNVVNSWNLRLASSMFCN